MILIKWASHVITFDDYGVSGHCNHRDVHYGVRNLLQETAPRGIDAWELKKEEDTVRLSLVVEEEGQEKESKGRKNVMHIFHLLFKVFLANYKLPHFKGTLPSYFVLVSW
ncbi:uncharacterized protein LOC130134803 [Syzygium oleosum]|uniref:uncharacterized protein LOC130134803 n=1 Tax=Syzygium oleosum TaxID=219896 RepID=UPI0024B909A4|nr:uncharacterized protein LOC130134803 [Syzygium oleosum]